MACLSSLTLPHKSGCFYLFIIVVWQPFQSVGGGRRGQSGFVNRRIKRTGNQQMEKLCDAIPLKKSQHSSFVRTSFIILILLMMQTRDKVEIGIRTQLIGSRPFGLLQSRFTSGRINSCLSRVLVVRKMDATRCRGHPLLQLLLPGPPSTSAICYHRRHLSTCLSLRLHLPFVSHHLVSHAKW